MNDNTIKLTTNIIVITAIFAVVISLLMLFNYLQLATNDPIESITMKAMVERLADDPNNEQLQAEIRAFDLMARKAYFTSYWQIKTGGWLLLIGAIILVVSLRYYHTLTGKIEEPESNPETQQTSRILASKWLLGTGGTLILLAILSSFLSVNQLGRYNPEKLISEANEDSIEVIDLTQKTKQATETVTEAIESPSKPIEKPEEPKPEKAIEVKKDVPIKAESQTKSKEQTSSYPSLADITKQYSSFRGPLGNGVSSAKNIPTESKIKWKVKVPTKGYSSPVIWEQKLFVTGATNTERWVYCYNTENGEIIWQQQANNITGSPSTAPKTTEDTGLAAPSVATNGKQVVAIFGTGDVIAFDTNGKRLWAQNLGVPDNHYGHSSSPLIWNEKIIIQFDSNKSGRLLTINIETGKIIWDINRSSNISWASPILINVDNKMQIVTSTEPTVGGYDLETGTELWKADVMMGEVGPSPTYANGLVFAANEYATLAAINPSDGTIVWEDNYYLPEVASPVVSDGLLFIATTYGVFACFDVHSAKMYWEAEFSEGFYSSPIIADGNVYAIDMSGEMHIIKVDRELKPIANFPLDESITTTPAFMDGRIYIRGSEHLICIGE